MDYNLKLGMKYISKKIVKEEDTAAKFGSGDIYVFSTPSMVGLMENAAMNAVQSELGEKYSTVGIHLDVKHLAATPMDMEVRAEAMLKEIDGKKLVFWIEVFDEKKKIGEGYHSRFIIDKEKFMNKINMK
ncbi:thioesterase family protein [Helicovermis profundi]|uniref:Thioesterase family protein n=1 Tax=Helicovermis profundi TaxID=3065157 RepID=A0AAU9EBI9_9FIRM|nr:thioesterase family protein [Clostridia bacterium S502]